MVDLYTKGVLTLIALALMAIAIENCFDRSHAGPLDPNQVEICGGAFGGATCVSLEPIEETVLGRTIKTYALPVVIKGERRP